jgi:pilus assembly protein Flp/PilA
MLLWIKTATGQGLAEYAIIIMLVALVVVILLAIYGPAVGNMFSTVVASF